MDFPVAHFTLSQAYYGKAIRLIEREQFEEAAPLLRQSLKHLPSNANAHYAMGLYYDFRGETGKAEKALRTALQHQPNHAAARDALQQIAKGK
jgi:Tfp pilus assembly protein PilF